MHFLLFMDALRTITIWAFVVLLFCASGTMIWAPRMLKGWRRMAVRAFGSALAVLLLLLLITLSLGVALGADPPREHIGFTSATGAKVALLSHSELRDSSTTQVTVKRNSCCTRYIAYEYYGDGSDYVGATSVQWIDDHHLVIRYARDPSGVQECHSQVGDVQILCEPQPAPAFDNKSGQR